MQAKIALTSATSFTGLWIADALHASGWEVHALCQSPRDAYSGLRAHRMALLEKRANVHYGISMTSTDLTEWISAHRPEIWIHHHHFMEEFRSPKYDIERARRFGLDPLPGVVEALERAGCHGIVYSGSYFEPGEGGSPENDPAATPYARSKREVWRALGEECVKRRIPLSKIVIPNPVGPFENEDRLIPKLIELAKTRRPLPVTAPDAVGDQLPVTALARCYDDSAEELLRGRARVARPSGWIVSVLDFVKAINAELIEKRLGLEAPTLEVTSNPPPAKIQRNTEPVSVDWGEVWDHYARWYKTYQ